MSSYPPLSLVETALPPDEMVSAAPAMSLKPEVTAPERTERLITAPLSMVMPSTT